jgi:hypothetical protein
MKIGLRACIRHTTMAACQAYATLLGKIEANDCSALSLWRLSHVLPKKTNSDEISLHWLQTNGFPWDKQTCRWMWPPQGINALCIIITRKTKSQQLKLVVSWAHKTNIHSALACFYLNVLWLNASLWQKALNKSTGRSEAINVCLVQLSSTLEYCRSCWRRDSHVSPQRVSLSCE